MCRSALSQSLLNPETFREGDFKKMLMQAINILRNSYYAEKTDNKFAKVTIVRYLKNQIRYQSIVQFLN